ncbi:acetylserotonin O-methyltransferase [Pseudonocardia alaniniphila]|uniref:Acetylserotonin O-methyltransferase n=1 Tax=Pseudonocardia alaniniphila TaxID=75291 RepID=A0ABS9TGK6_9PSEU|nr:acetylserotonin O-methyltransferase [Pseudonocardia alaniniphila]MCH6167675.1 acetylserotonin O-methyltransferase [Pseudonocardia alaniniphila]
MPQSQLDDEWAWRLLEIINAGWMSQVVRTAAELGIPDLLARGPRSAPELAAATETHAPTLRRLLRGLATLDICSELDDGSFDLAPMGRLLRTDAELSLRSWAIHWGRDLWTEWAYLIDGVLTGLSARELINAKSHDGLIIDNPARATAFIAGMGELTRVTAHGIMSGYDFRTTERLVDVGGGRGDLLAAVLKENPAVQGVLFELPDVIDHARPYLQRAGVADRCTLVAGSFFDDVPAGPGVYVLKSVLRNWNDDRARDLLTTCRRAMTGSSNLLVIEHLVPDVMEVDPVHRSLGFIDLLMLVTQAARERTESECRTLLSAAGFTTTAVTAVARNLTLVEAVPTT